MFPVLILRIGKADARNEGVALRAAPPYDPSWRKEFSVKMPFYCHEKRCLSS